MMRVRGKLGAGETSVDLQIEAGRITGIRPADLTTTVDLGDEDLFLAPGLIDLQINGYAGIDWNDGPVETDQLAEAAHRLLATGVVAFLPTLITGAEDHFTRVVAAIAQAIDEDAKVARACPGIHLEGPYISPIDGPRGAHPREHVRPPDWEEFARWQEAAGGRIRLITLAPEWPEALEFIERATAAGVIVALGHTAASAERIAEAASAGATFSTHLGNGSHAVLPRHENYIWAQLADDRLAASFIVDGHHLPPPVVKCMLRAKTIEKSILVTDAISAAGLGPGHHRLGKIQVEVSESGRVSLPGTPYLAGSVLEMHTAVANTVRFTGLTLAEALQMANLNPARVIGIEDEYGVIAEGGRANLILFHWDEDRGSLQIAATIVDGEVGYRYSDNSGSTE
jgi:N-acetylglucosamine-6-phosphate deacetylase